MPYRNRSRSAVLSTTILVLLGFLVSGSASAQGRSASLEPVSGHGVQAATIPVTEPPARIATAVVEPLAALVEAERGAADQLAAMAAWNRGGNLPVQVGIVRPLPVTAPVRFGEGLAEAPAGLHAGGAFARVGSDATVWGTTVRVDEAHRLRLVLEDVSLPAGTRMWVYGEDGEARGFGPELAHEGALWTPSVWGAEIRLEVELSREALAAGGTYGFSVARVAEIFPLGADGAPVLDGGVAAKVHDDCLVDVSCRDASTFPMIAQASTAVARIEFPAGFGMAWCTGGLLNLADGAPSSLVPPFLTANHCLSSQSAAAALEAFWDFRTTSCNGSAPSLSSVPRTLGATLLATGGESDYTLLALQEFPPAPPGGVRYALGWTAQTPVLPKDTVLHRISYPIPDFPTFLPQQYTQYRVKGEDEFLRCGENETGADTDDPTKFYHTVFLDGGSFGGSSGAPLMTGDGRVVGQLFGVCGPNTEDGCSVSNDELDGNFYTTFDRVAPFLGASDWLTTPEIPGFEFQVLITGASPVEGRSEADCIPETFCASGALAGRPEVFVKIIGPRPNGFLWVQISRFTPSQVEVMVRQTATGDVNEYMLPAVGGQADDVPGLQDREAFSP